MEKSINKSDFISLLKKEEIFSVDIRFNRYINSGDTKILLLEGFSIPCAHFIQNNIEEKIKFKSNTIVNLDYNRYFIDPFLAHKTLVLLGDSEDFSRDIKAINNSILKDSVEIEFCFTQVQEEIKVKCITPPFYHTRGIRTKTKYATPPFDYARDIRTEIVMALLQIKVDAIGHFYESEKNMQVIEIKLSKDIFQQIDDIQKFQYACLMVAKAYNIDINKNKGIFSINPTSLLLR